MEENKDKEVDLTQVDVKPETTSEKVEVNKDALDKLVARVEEQDKKLEMLEAVADKSRVFNYQNRGKRKEAIKVHLAVCDGKYLIGWKTLKDQLIKHPVTGVVTGEVQEYEIKLIDDDGKTSTQIINSYPAFSDVRYNERVLVDVINKTTDYDDNVTYEVRLPKGRQIKLPSQFVN